MSCISREVEVNLCSMQTCGTAEYLVNAITLHQKELGGLVKVPMTGTDKVCWACCQTVSGSLFWVQAGGGVTGDA